MGAWSSQGPGSLQRGQFCPSVHRWDHDARMSLRSFRHWRLSGPDKLCRKDALPEEECTRQPALIHTNSIKAKTGKPVPGGGYFAALTGVLGQWTAEKCQEMRLGRSVNQGQILTAVPCWDKCLFTERGSLGEKIQH